MTITSLTKHGYDKTSFNQSMIVILSIGTIIGVMVGDSMLNRIIEDALYPVEVK